MTKLKKQRAIVEFLIVVFLVWRTGGYSDGGRGRRRGGHYDFILDLSVNITAVTVLSLTCCHEDKIDSALL